MTAITLVGNYRRVIPVQEIAKSRKTKGDADSQLAKSNVKQDLIVKIKRKKLLDADMTLSSYIYSKNGIEKEYATTISFDRKA